MLLIKLLASSPHTLPSHTCISQCCLKREPAKTTSAYLEFGGAYNAACGNAFHLPGMSMVFTEQTGLGQRLSGPFPSSLTSGCRTLAEHGQLILWAGMLWARPDVYSINFPDRQPAFIHLISATLVVFGVYISFDHSKWLAPFTQMSDIPNPQCSDFLSITQEWTGIALRKTWLVATSSHKFCYVFS